MVQAIGALDNLIREGRNKVMTKKEKLVRSLMKKRHSPAGAKYLAEKKTKKGAIGSLAGGRITQRLRDAGLTEAEIKKMHKKKK